PNLDTGEFASLSARAVGCSRKSSTGGSGATVDTEEAKGPALVSDTRNPSRRDFLYLTTGMAGIVGAAAFSLPFIDQMRPDASTLAMASVEVDVSSLTPGTSLVVKWRGKPVVVRYRTDAEIEDAADTQLDVLKDPL